MPRFRQLGVAAAAGLAALCACAVVFHIANGDPGGDIAPAIVQFAISTGYVIVSRQRAELPSTTRALAI